MNANSQTARDSTPNNHIHYIRPASYNFAGTSDNLAYNGGPVMAGTAQVYAIFWEPTGSFVSANYNSLILRYFGDVGSTGLYANNSQYTDSTGAAPSKAVLAGSWVDTSPYSSSTLQDSDIQNEVTNAQNVNGWTSDITHVFFVFTAQNETICSGSECSFTTFCGYHSFFGTNTIYAAMPYVGGVQGCNTPSSPNNDDADSTINVASHEQMESATDPLLNAWMDSSGQEIGDKCNFTFATTTASDGSDVTWNNDPYLVQEEWDNAQNGCVITGP
nr:hypothetical protein [Ktedonobacteraceae bacterium]